MNFEDIESFRNWHFGFTPYNQLVLSYNHLVIFITIWLQDVTNWLISGCSILTENEKKKKKNEIDEDIEFIEERNVKNEKKEDKKKKDEIDEHIEFIDKMNEDVATNTLVSSDSNKEMDKVDEFLSDEILRQQREGDG